MVEKNKIIQDWSELTVIEAAELSKLLEEKWGVSAATPVAVSASARGETSDQAERRERAINTQRRVILSQINEKVWNDAESAAAASVERLINVLEQGISDTEKRTAELRGIMMRGGYNVG